MLSDAWNPSPLPETQSMAVCLLFMMVLLAKEAQLVDETVSLGAWGELWLLSMSFSPDDVFRCFPDSAYELLLHLHSPQSSSK